MRFTAAFGPEFYGPVKPTTESYQPHEGKRIELTRKDGRSFTATVAQVWVDEEYDTVYAMFDAGKDDPDTTSVRQLGMSLKER